ncbi:MAG: glycyl-radical enzyme activating protein, partial [Desulfobacteraceae bacterium]|nr:glycyl-radical enzyme activating protein [Desulfobacteraceae bacterium]
MELNNQQNADPTALVFSVQQFCLHDGPGVRSTIFFKGCPLRCSWCQNPESWSKKPEIAFKQHLCIGCRTCVDKCPEQALSDPGHRNEDKCVSCFTCVEGCSSTAMVCFGDLRSIGSVIDELEPEFPFYLNSKGGVTFSGGEPTLYSEFLLNLTKDLQNKDIHVSMETCGYFSINDKAIEDSTTSL